MQYSSSRWIFLPVFILLACTPEPKDSTINEPIDADQDGYASTDDCNDTDAAIHPGAQEVCGGGDEDCDGLVDDADDSVTGTTAFYADTDGDGYGDSATEVYACVEQAGIVADSTDCNDTDAAIHPGAQEVCGGGDEDCDGLVDDADDSVTGMTAFYADTDGDGYGDSATEMYACVEQAGMLADSTDCNDTDAAIHPGAQEVCGGGDEDCDGLVDDADDSVTGTTAFYADTDGDGYGDSATEVYACVEQAGIVADSTDYDDTDPLVWLNPTYEGNLTGGFTTFCGDSGERTITGDLNLSSATQADVDSLYCVVAVGEEFKIESNAALVNVDGLSNLTSVGSNINISGNAALMNVDGLSNLTSFNAALYITNNAVLMNVDGLSGIMSGSYFRISYNAALTNVDGLSNLTSIGGGIAISDNAALTNVGLSRLTTTGDLRIANNDALITVNSFPMLTYVGNYLYIDDNAVLTNVDGFSNLTTVGHLYITDNDALTSVDGFSGITSLTGNFYVTQNPVLCDSNIMALGFTGHVYGNDSSC